MNFINDIYPFKYKMNELETHLLLSLKLFNNDEFKSLNVSLYNYLKMSSGILLIIGLNSLISRDSEYDNINIVKFEKYYKAASIEAGSGIIAETHPEFMSKYNKIIGSNIYKKLGVYRNKISHNGTSYNYVFPFKLDEIKKIVQQCNELYECVLNDFCYNNPNMLVDGKMLSPVGIVQYNKIPDIASIIQKLK